MRVTASAALLALRMWWPIVTVCALIGGAYGAYSVRDAPYMAVTTVRVDTAGFGEVAQQSIVQTARLLVDSNRTYAKVAGDTPEGIEELRQRTAVDIVESSSILEISVSAQTPDRAERDLNALVEASMTSMRELADEQFTGTVRSGQTALSGGVLPDPAAEEARRAGIGTAISERQDNALRLSAQLSRIGAILPATRTGLGARLAAAIGFVAGGFAGAVLTLMLGVGRRRIKRLADVRAVAPGLLPAAPLEYTKGIITVGNDCSRIDAALAVVLALPGAEDDLPDVVDAVRSELTRNGSRPFRLDADDVVRADDYATRRGAPSRPGFDAGNGHRLPGGSVATVSAGLPALGMPQRAVDLAASQADVLLVTGMASERILTLAAGRADVVLLVARPYRTTLGQLAAVTANLGDGRPPVVVLAPRHTSVERGGSRDEPEAAAPARSVPSGPQPEFELVRPGHAPMPGPTLPAPMPSAPMPSAPMPSVPSGSDRSGSWAGHRPNALDSPTLRIPRPGTPPAQGGAPLVPAVVSTGTGPVGSDGSAVSATGTTSNGSNGSGSKGTGTFDAAEHAVDQHTALAAPAAPATRPSPRSHEETVVEDGTAHEHPATDAATTDAAATDAAATDAGAGAGAGADDAAAGTGTPVDAATVVVERAPTTDASESAEGTGAGPADEARPDPATGTPPR